MLLILNYKNKASMQIPFGVSRIVIFFVFSLVCRLGLAQATYPVQVFYFDYAADYQTVYTLGSEDGIKESGSFPFTIKDRSGNTFEVNELGEVKPISSSGSDIRLDEATKETPHTELAVLQFEATPNTKYALDAYRDVYAKFMLPGVSDEIRRRLNEIYNPVGISCGLVRGHDLYSINVNFIFFLEKKSFATDFF
ncbi:MAG: hypothetical protein LBL58_19325 [Tannerellaceae bacterium]|jgi:hypothetical protein|nr:hypothetical protein [Tannerellaceae bacterium]